MKVVFLHFAHKSKQLVGALLTCVGLSACAVLDPPRIERPTPLSPLIVERLAPPSDGDTLMAYVLQTRKLSAEELIAEQNRVRAEFGNNGSEYNRVKLGVMLALTPTASALANSGNSNGGSVGNGSGNGNEDTELIALLDPLVFSTTASGTSVKPELRALAHLLQTVAQDRKRLRDLAKVAQTKITVIKRDESSVVESKQLKVRIEDLERQLSALKSIEKSVGARSDGGTK